jgi:hypothetical protein
MKVTFMHKHKQWLALFFIFIMSSGAVAAPIPPDKMKPEEVVAKHLAAIGPADALAAAKSRIVAGDVKVINHSTAVRDIVGQTQIVSEGDKVVLAMVFNTSGYAYEKAGFDGDKMTVSLMENTGKRSALGDFLKSQEAIVKQGLLGGVLSSAWPLLNVAAKNPKLSYSGTKKIDNRQVHEIKYRPSKGGGDMQISLFFDAETFHHVRTEYQYSVSARMGARPGGIGASASSPITGNPSTDTGSQTMNRYKLVEEFSDFKTEGQLTLPHTYKIRLTIEAQRTLMIDWINTLTQFNFNQPIDAAAFNVSSSK